MKVCVFGTGYVGLVAGACFAESGNDVICVDIDENKINRLKQGILPIYEPGLEEMVKRNVDQKRLLFTTDATMGIQKSLFQFIAVGTPPGEDGSADLQYVLRVANTIAENMEEFKIVVNKSTVPVGTADKVRNEIQSVLNEQAKNLEFDVVSNPEFLKEGVAIRDFLEPDRVVIGSDNPRTIALIKELYNPFMTHEEKMIVMDIRSAEMTKYAANALLATKISFINEIANLCDNVQANIDHVRLGIGSDIRIGPYFLFPGIGYGGSCFPKDVQALIQTGKEEGKKMEILQAVESINEQQKERLVHMIKSVMGENLENKKIGLWGLSFKPKTDDMREAPSKIIIEKLLNMNANIVAHDPASLQEAKKLWSNQIQFKEYPYDILKDIDALLILTEWSDYHKPDFEKMKTLMKAHLIFDGRNMYSLEDMKNKGFEYHSIGRPPLYP